jgi:transposase
MAGLARVLWSLGKCVRSVLPLAAQWNLASGLTVLTATSGCPGQVELGSPSRRWQCDSRPSALSGCKKGALDPASLLSEIEQVQEREALGRSKGGFSTKIHLRCDGNGLPITFLITVGQRHETVVFEQLMEQGAVPRSSSGRPRLRPHRVVGDKGYSSGAIRRYLRCRGIRVTIPRKDNEKHRGKFDKSIYRTRNVVERCFNRLKQFRRIATRYEKKAENYLTMLTLASIQLWL